MTTNVGEIAQAIADGKTIEWKFSGKKDWQDCINPRGKTIEILSNKDFEFRIKPEPRKVWIWERAGYRHAYDEKQHSKALTNCSNAGTTKDWKVYGPFELDD